MLPMHRNIAMELFIEAQSNKHTKAKQVQLQNLQHKERELDIIEISISICSLIIINFSGIMNKINNISITKNLLIMIHKHRKFITPCISKIINSSGSKL